MERTGIEPVTSGLQSRGRPETAELLPGRVLENEVEKALRERRCAIGLSGGVAWGENWRALLRRREPRGSSTRNAWVVFKFEKKEA